MIRVSPFHEIDLAEDLLRLIEKPFEQDFIVRQISKKTVNDQPLIQGELVISGTKTMEQHPLAKTYPVHFRKTYYPLCFHQDPAREYQNQLAASEIIPVAPPIGSTRTSFRSCFVPGTPYSRLSPFGAEPEEQNLVIGQKTSDATLIGLWTVLSRIYDQVCRLHENGFVHGDLFLHNIIVSPSPIGAHMIDFEQGDQKGDKYSNEEWSEKTRADLRELLREAVFVQCALGRQPDALGEASRERLPDLVQDPDRFLREMP